MSRRCWAVFVLCLAWCPGCAAPLPDEGGPVWGYYVGSRVKDPKARGGFGTSDNYPRHCDDGTPGERGEVTLVACPDRVVRRDGRDLMTLLLINRTAKQAEFSARDSHLYLVQEARARDGSWQPIETYVPCFCGNSYHRVFLPPGEYWELGALRYSGSYKTKLRFKLSLEHPDDGDSLPIYSNEFDGSVDPWRFARPNMAASGKPAGQ